MSSPADLISCATIPALYNSDHLGLSVLLSVGNPPQRPKSIPRRIWRYSLANFDLACKLLDNTDWNSIFSDDVTTTWENWRSTFLQIMARCIPQSCLKSKRNLPWLTKSVTQVIRKRNTLFRAAKKCKSTAAYQKYRAARNRAVALLRLNKSKFFRSLGTRPNKDFWKAIKLLNNQQSSIPALNHNSVKVESNLDKAVLLNTFFYKCFNKSVPPLNNPNNSLAIKPIQCRSSQFLNSFFPRTASQWNSLPASVVSQSTSSAFKHCLINY